MSDSTQTILEAVLKLPEQERTELAMRVLESLPTDDGLAMDDEDLIEQLEERRKDTSGSIPWTELRAEFK
jgi:hypothetical protein